MSLALNSGKAFISGKLVRANILIEGGKIKSVSAKKISAEKEIDCTGKTILPGAIDCHVHFRTPGFEHKEDMDSGSQGALRGGVTTVMDMPNTSPATTTVGALQQKRSLAATDCRVNFDAYMAATGKNFSEIEDAPALRAVKIYFGSSTGNMLFNNEAGIMWLFSLAKQKGFIVAAHAEDEAEIQKNTEKFRTESNPVVHMKIRSDIAETKAVKTLCTLQGKIGNRLHIAHLSSKKGLEAVKKAKRGKTGKNVTCEVTPNHLFLSSKDYKKLGNLIKCNPSIKSEADRKALWKGFKAGAIDMIATDHAPHTREEKGRGYWEAPSGIPGVETMLPLLLDAVARKKITLKRVVQTACEKPAQIFGWNTKGSIKEGFDADLIVVDMKKTLKVEDQKLATKAGYSPFNGQKLKGVVEKTIVGGVVFEN